MPLGAGARKLIARFHFFSSPLPIFDIYSAPGSTNKTAFASFIRDHLEAVRRTILQHNSTGGANVDPRPAEESSHHLRRGPSDGAGSCQPDGGAQHRRRTGSAG